MAIAIPWILNTVLVRGAEVLSPNGEHLTTTYVLLDGPVRASRWDSR